MLLVDTSIISLAVRRKQDDLSERERESVSALMRAIEDGEAAIADVVRQELLSGVRSIAQYERIRRELAAFKAIAVSSATHELAAALANRCLDRGVITGHVDILLCAIAVERDIPIWTADPDFARCAAVLSELKLYVAAHSA